MRIIFPALVLLTAAACAEADGTGTGTIDSVVPWDTALARFREGLDPVDTLRGGAPTRDALIQRFVAALETADTAALTAMALSRAEFAWLYYPTVPEAHPPYDLRPGLMWFMVEGNSSKGLRRALEEYGGTALRVVGHRCEGEPRVFGENRVHPLCVLRRLQAPGDTLEERLFGPIVERDGRFKFVSLANKL